MRSSILTELEDPLELCPLAAILEHMASLIRNSSEMGGCSYNQVSAKYRTFPEEMAMQEHGLVIGNAFVLAQAEIERTVAFVRRASGSGSRQEEEKRRWMRFGSRVHAGTGQPEILLFDALANYFKHHSAWETNQEGSAWLEGKHSGRTVRLVRKLGLTPGTARDLENLHVAVTALGWRPDEIGRIVDSLEAWRSEIAKYLQRTPEPVAHKGDSRGLDGRQTAQRGLTAS